MNNEYSKVFFNLSGYQYIFATATPQDTSKTYESIPILREDTEQMLFEKLVESKLVDSVGYIKALFTLNNGEDVEQKLLNINVSGIANPGDIIRPFYYSYDEGEWYIDGNSSAGEYYQLTVDENGVITGFFTLSEALAFQVMDAQYYEDNGVYNFGEEDSTGTAEGDYDYGGLEDGIDPDTVADGDYDFNYI